MKTVNFIDTKLMGLQYILLYHTFNDQLYTHKFQNLSFPSYVSIYIYTNADKS